MRSACRSTDCTEHPPQRQAPQAGRRSAVKPSVLMFLKAGQSVYIFCANSDPLFSFSPTTTKTDFAFLWHAGENEYRQKSVSISREKKRLPVPGWFPKEGWEACLWHTILLARSSVLYLLFREAGKGVVSPSRTAHLYLPKTAAKNCEGMSRVCCCFHQGSKGEMK